jgi:MGT family glycosyltransferase
MSSYLLCSSPIHGHIVPMLAIARYLVSCGHQVSLLSGSRFHEAIAQTGASPLSLDGRADYDDRTYIEELPERHQHKGIGKIRYDVETVFVLPLPDQYRALQRALTTIQPDIVVGETAFMGLLALLRTSPAHRPPVATVGVLPLAQMSRDAAPFGLGLAPLANPLGRWRNRLLNSLVQQLIFRSTQAQANQLLGELGAPALDVFLFDYASRGPDLFLQLCAAEFEYPRSDLSANLRFVGPVLPAASAHAEVPPWWGELEAADCPVVHVTQGTIDNKDMGRLIRPALDALAGHKLLLVVSTGGRPLAELGPLPANVRAAEFLPYDRLMPLTDLFITNAGYGGVQFALSHGVPIIAAGDSEDKVEVCARVAWSGVGLNLKSGTPTVAAIARAVEQVLAEPAYRTRARALATAIRSHDTLQEIERELEQLIASRV